MRALQKLLHQNRCRGYTFRNMEGYKATIGLEVHAQLCTKTKMFSRSKNDPDETRPNVNISPIDLGHPGTLPVINKEAVSHVIRVGVAACGKIADYTEFDRKNYFYPDIPKGYQISQYKHPLVNGGEIAGVKLTRIHLEEDTGTSQHDKGEYSLVNFNRAGTPLLELVTDPVIHSGKDASFFAREFQLLLQYLKVSNANMEKGEMRLEANISVSKTDSLGVKVEVKNLNSFKSLEKAIDFEISRQINSLEAGNKIEQETRGWHDEKQITFSQRKKEGSADYRYFPDPDLPKLKISEIPEFNVKNIKKELPVLPWDKREKLISLGLGEDQVELLVGNRLFGDFFDGVAVQIKDNKQIKIFANYLTSDLVGYGGGIDLGKLTEESAVTLSLMVVKNEISSRGAKDLLKILFEKGGEAREVAESQNLLQKSDEGELTRVVDKIISENKSVAEEYKNGKKTSIQFLVGQGMKETKGSANPQVLKKLFEESLK